MASPATPTSQLWCWMTQSKNVGCKHAAVNDTRWPFEDQREGHGTGRMLSVDGDLVLGKTRVVRADVARV